MSNDKDFIVYDSNGKPERRINLRLTLQSMEFYLKVLKNRQGDCDTDRKDIRDTAEEAERKIDNHVLISKDREGRGRFTFVRITTVVGLMIAIAAIFVSYLFVCKPVHGSEMKPNISYVSSQSLLLSKTERIQEFIYGVNVDTSTRELGMKLSCNNAADERPVLIIKLSKQCLKCKGCREHVVPILKRVSDIISSGWLIISDSRRMDFVNRIGEIIYITDVNGGFKKVESVI